MKKTLALILTILVAVLITGCQGNDKLKADFLKYESAPDKATVLKDFEKYSPELSIGEYDDEDEENYKIKNYTFDDTPGTLWLTFSKSNSVMKKIVFVTQLSDTDTAEKWMESLNDQFGFYKIKHPYEERVGATYYWYKDTDKEIMLDYAQSEANKETIYTEISEVFK